MSRTSFFRLGILAGILSSANITHCFANSRSSAHAMEKIEVATETIKYRLVDATTNPATPLQDVSFLLNDARSGTPQSPGGTLPVEFAGGLVNPGPDDLGDAGLVDVFYTGAPGDFPAASFLDVLLGMTDPNTGQAAELKNGNVKFFNEQKGFGFVVSGHVPGEPEYLYSLTGEINPAQVGLSFADVPVVPGGPPANSFFDVFTELQFDGTATINPDLPLFTLTLTPVPEPASYVLAGIGMAAFVVLAGKQRMKAL